jgi:hypothetical protein
MDRETAGDRDVAGVNGAGDRLEAALRQNRPLWEILDRFGEIGLPDAWLVAGAIAQTVWNLAAGHRAERGIKDADLVYFDADDLSGEAEAAHERRIRERFAQLPYKIDVKNEARVHLWYEARFGYPIRPYGSVAEAIATFPTTATAVGVRRRGARFEYCAPYGLDDLWALVVRPNQLQITREVYQAKLDRWRVYWPHLTFLPWAAPTAAGAGG